MASLMGRVITDLGAVALAPLLVIGERLGLFASLADGGPRTSTELAEATGKGRLEAADIASAALWAVDQPPHLGVSEMLIRPSAQPP